MVLQRRGPESHQLPARNLIEVRIGDSVHSYSNKLFRLFLRHNPHNLSGRMESSESYTESGLNKRSALIEISIVWRQVKHYRILCNGSQVLGPVFYLVLRNIKPGATYTCKWILQTSVASTARRKNRIAPFTEYVPCIILTNSPKT